MPSAVRSLSEPATSQKWTNVNSSLFRSRVSSVTSLGRSSRKATTSATTSTPRRSVTSPTVLSLNPRIGKKTPSGPTLSSLTTPWLRAAKPRPFAPPASPSSALPPTPTASKTTAPSARNSSNLPASASFPTKTSIPSTPPLISSRRIPTVMSSNLAVKRRTSSAACSWGKKKTAKTSSACSTLTRKPFPTKSKSFNSSAASTASRSPSALSSTAKNSSRPSTSTSSTRNFSPAKSDPPPVKWAPPCFGASRISYSTALSSRWSPSLPKKATSATSTSIASSTTTAFTLSEFTSRFGYPTISIQQEGMLTPISDFFWELATGVEPKWRTRSGFQIGIRIVVPPFPFDDDATFESFSKNNAIVFKKPNMEGMHIEDVKEVNGQWLIAGTSGVVLVVVGTGQTMKQAQAQVYSRTKNVLIPNMYYRTDIGDRWSEDSDKLHNWGYLR